MKNLDAKRFSLKRATWAYGCAAKGSDDEQALLGVLLVKAEEKRVKRDKLGNCSACGAYFPGGDDEAANA